MDSENNMGENQSLPSFDSAPPPAYPLEDPLRVTTMLVSGAWDFLCYNQGNPIMNCLPWLLHFPICGPRQPKGKQRKSETLSECFQEGGKILTPTIYTQLRLRSLPNTHMDSMGEAEKKKSAAGLRDAEHGVWHGERESLLQEECVKTEVGSKERSLELIQ